MKRPLKYIVVPNMSNKLLVGFKSVTVELISETRNYDELGNIYMTYIVKYIGENSLPFQVNKLYDSESVAEFMINKLNNNLLERKNRFKEKTKVKTA